MKKPFFSILIVVLNGRDKIGETVNSVLAQTCTDYEIIIKDGGSKDGTLDAVPANDKIKTYVISDKSVYDAMNQATELAQGKYVFYLNCGDILYNKNVLEKVKNHIGNKKYGVVYGDYEREGTVLKQAANMTEFQLIRKPLCHQSMFFNTLYSLKYDINYKLSADYDLTAKLLKEGAEFSHIDQVICTYEGGGISEVNTKLLFIEAKKIRKNQFSQKCQLLHKLYSIVTLSAVRWMIVSGKIPEPVHKVYYFFRNIVTK